MIESLPNFSYPGWTWITWRTCAWRCPISHLRRLADSRSGMTDGGVALVREAELGGDHANRCREPWPQSSQVCSVLMQAIPWFFVWLGVFCIFCSLIFLQNTGSAMKTSSCSKCFLWKIRGKNLIIRQISWAHHSPDCSDSSQKQTDLGGMRKWAGTDLVSLFAPLIFSPDHHPTFHLQSSVLVLPRIYQPGVFMLLDGLLVFK